MTETQLEVRREPGPARPRVPHTVHLRELQMPDGRKLLLDRRSIAFLCEGKPEEFGGKVVTVCAFRLPAKPVPVVAPYTELKAWWVGEGKPNGKAPA